MNALAQLYDASISIAGHPITWREILGNGFGFASAVGGLRRKVWAWPVGIAGNVLLFTVFIAATFEADAQVPLFGQAGRQVFFVLTSIYGWQRWRSSRAARRHVLAGGHQAADQLEEHALTPRWATTTERLPLLVAAVAGVVLLQWVFSIIGAGFPAPRWYYWCDAWIFVGSMVATYAMARGWTDFWVAWIAVDLVGVPLLWHSGYYPTAVLFVVYGALVVAGLVVWSRAARTETPPPTDRPHRPEKESVA
jgi:nicotinamide mononucleotide transporter